MKKLIQIFLLTVLVSVIVPGKCYSQTMGGDHEFSAGVGLLSLDQFFGTIAGDIGRAIVSLGNVSTTNVEIKGAYYLTYQYYIRNRFSAGLTLVTDRVSGDLQNRDDEITGSFKRHYFTIAPEIKFVYMNNKAVRLYGIAGIGYTLGSETTFGLSGAEDGDSKWSHINFQVTPLGIRFGRTFGVFAEIGIGYKGFLSGGMSYYF